ncbi:MAG: murein biosynthesis integral membrane protein MurJ [Bryobacteraceae bacterium]|nr:murein biosynthesis integral membrane protein MurJ [Bryobacteraceae bacterium]
MVRSAGVVSLAILVSRVSGLVREIVMARLFGAGQAYDAFLLGFRIPNLTRDLFAEGALSSAFVPTFTHYLSTRGRQEAAGLAHVVATALLLVVGAVCGLGIVFSPQLVGLLAPGFAAVPEKFALAVTLTRIMFPFLLFVALAAQAMGMLNALDRFGVPAMASTFFNIGSIGFGLVLGFLVGPWLGFEPIVGMAWGVVLGGVWQWLWQMPSLVRLGIGLRWRLDWSHPGLRQILQLMGPALVGSAAVQINVMVNTNLASRVVDPLTGPDGPVSWLGYAFRFMQLPLGLFGVALASATLPAISRSISAGNLEEFRHTVSHSLGMVFLLTVPSSVGLAVLGEPIIGAIYEGGRFRAYDTQQTALALSWYALGLAGYAALKVLTPAFYALGDSRTPMWVSVGSIAVNYVVASTMVNRGWLGHAGLALATSAVALFGFLTLFWILRGRLRGIDGHRLAWSVVRISAASAVMGQVVDAARAGLEGWLGVSRMARLLNLAACIPLGVLCFWALCRIAEVPELDSAHRAWRGWLRGGRARI